MKKLFDKVFGFLVNILCDVLFVFILSICRLLRSIVILGMVR